MNIKRVKGSQEKVDPGVDRKVLLVRIRQSIYHNPYIDNPGGMYGRAEKKGIQNNKGYQ